MTDLTFYTFDMKDLINFESLEGHDVWKVMERHESNPHSVFLTVKTGSNFPVCLAGLVEIRPGIAEVCVFRSKCYKRFSYEFSKTIKRVVQEYVPQKYPELRRLEMIVDKAWEGADKWAEFLGFEKDGIYVGYSEDMRVHNRYFRLLKEPNYGD